MARIETIGDATLFLGDCREILPTLSKVDAIVTDPPYGIGHRHSGRGAIGGASSLSFRRNSDPLVGDDAPFDPSHLLTIADDVILWGASHFAQQLPHGRWYVWDKLGSMDSFDSFSDIEIAWHNKRGADRIFRHMWKGICQDSEKGSKRHHPTQKPIALMAWSIGRVKGNTVCDPYMGSGTTGVAATKLGRPFVGIEIEAKYFDIACRRVAETSRNPDLFARPTRNQQQDAFAFANPRVIE